MTRLLVHVEGDTEEAFVRDVLSGHLYNLGYTAVSARMMGEALPRVLRGGIVSWRIARREIVSRLLEDSELIVSTMVDYYGMPNDWPGRADATASGLATAELAALIEDAMLEDVRSRMDRNFNVNRFVPYVMMHEFEAMLFSDCDRFAYAVGSPHLSRDFQRIRDAFANPEDIDDSPTSAPSKRIELLLPAYQKPTMGVQAAQNIGLDAIRGECPHFRGWLGRLESIA